MRTPAQSAAAAKQPGRDFEALFRAVQVGRPDWKSVTVQERNDAAAAVLAGNANLVALREVGQRLRAHYLAVAVERAKVANDPSLSEVGREGRYRSLAEAAERGLTTILSAAAKAHGGLPLPAPLGLGMSAEDAARVEALVAILPTWAPEDALAGLEAAVQQDDLPVLRFVLPAVRQFAAVDSRYPAFLPRLADLAEEAELRLTSPVRHAQEVAAVEADRLWAGIRGIVGAVERNGGLWDATHDFLLEPEG